MLLPHSRIFLTDLRHRQIAQRDKDTLTLLSAVADKYNVPLSTMARRLDCQGLAWEYGVILVKYARQQAYELLRLKQKPPKPNEHGKYATATDRAIAHFYAELKAEQEQQEALEADAELTRLMLNQGLS